MRRKRKRKPKVAYRAGSYGSTVRILDAGPGKGLRVECRYAGKRRKRSLGHRDLERAKRFAAELSAKLSEGVNVIPTHRPTVSIVTGEYLSALANRPKQKGRRSQYHDRRCAELWSRFFGPNLDLHRLRLADWERFQKERATGSIDALGNPVAEGKRKRVRPRTVAADLKWVGHVMNWATRWKLPDGSYLMRENPARGFDIPNEKNPRRPVASWERHEKIRVRAQEVTMMIIQDGKPRKTPSYLGEILDLAVATGRRRSAICALRYRDLRLDSPRPDDLPPDAHWYGEIRWSSESDKQGKAWTTPINALARAALDRVLEQRPPFNPDAFLFPAPKDPTKPIRGDVASRWLRQAEKLAGVPKHDGSLWHAYRRMWATERKDLPVQDVAKAGGWRDLKTLQVVYQQADTATTYAVVTHRSRERDQKVETR